MRTRKPESLHEVLFHVRGATQQGVIYAVECFLIVLIALVAGLVIHLIYRVANAIAGAWSVELTVLVSFCAVGFVVGVVSYIRLLK